MGARHARFTSHAPYYVTKMRTVAYRARRLSRITAMVHMRLPDSTIATTSATSAMIGVLPRRLRVNKSSLIVTVADDELTPRALLPILSSVENAASAASVRGFRALSLHEDEVTFRLHDASRPFQARPRVAAQPK